MRYRKQFVVGLCAAVIGTVASYAFMPDAALVAQQPATNDDPFGGGSQPTEKRVASIANTDNATVLRRQDPDERIRQALNKPCTLDFDEAPWSDVKQELESLYRFNILLTPSARDDSLDVDEPITVSLKGISLGNALRLMLSEKNATFVVQDEVLKIISLDDVKNPDYFTRRMIDISGIVNSANLWHHKQRATNHTRHDSGPVDGGMDMGMDMGMGKRSGGRSFQPQVDENTLTDLVLHSVQPDAWRDNPYGFGNSEQKPTATGLATCTGFCGNLIVNGPEELLDEVESFVRKIEANFADR